LTASPYVLQAAIQSTMKTIGSIASLIAITFLVVSGTGVASGVQGTTTGCQKPTPQQLSSLPSISNDVVVAVAKTSAQFQALAHLTSSVMLSGVSYDSHLDSSSCTLVPTAVDGTFIATYSNSSQMLMLVTETVPPAVVTNVQQMPMIRASVGTDDQAYWSGYQFCWNAFNCPSGGSEKEILDADGLFYQPTVDFPYSHGSDQPGCGVGGSQYCQVLTWVGLSTGATSGHLLQTGTIGEALSCSHCGIFYYLFWEDFNSGCFLFCSGANICSLTINAGDKVIPQIEYQSNGYWYVSAFDATTQNNCTPSSEPYYWPQVPLFANYILERPQIGCCGHASLPYFSTFNFNGELEIGTTFYTLYTPWNNGWGTWYRMWNGGTENICSGSGSSQGSCTQSIGFFNQYGYFTNTWLTSQYT
jgi:hypothetical protein